jgi:hypothetical protein
MCLKESQVQSGFRHPAAANLHSAIIAPKFCAAASYLFSMPCRNNGAVGDARKGAGIGVIVISSPSRRGAGKDAEEDRKPSLLSPFPLRRCAKFRSGNYKTAFAAKPTANLTFPQKNARSQTQQPRSLIASVGLRPSRYPALRRRSVDHPSCGPLTHREPAGTGQSDLRIPPFGRAPGGQASRSAYRGRRSCLLLDTGQCASA